MRPLLIALLLLLALLANFAEAPAAEPSPTPTWPLWDGAESVEQYGKRTGLEPTRTLDLGNGVKLEMVLIPAGKFVMGTEEPEPVDEVMFRQEIATGQIVFGLGTGALLVLVGFVAGRAIRRRQRLRFSLSYLVLLVFAAGVGLLGGTRWWEAARAFSEATAEYQVALVRFRDARDWEKPAHEVTLTKPYYMGKFEVTQEQYEQVTGSNPSGQRGRGLPVECVCWNDAQQFCRKTSEKTGLLVRLPTEAEWENACRAGTRTTYNTGDAVEDLDRAGWYVRSRGGTHPVGQKAPNAWGLSDMHGNVWEWCADWYGAYKTEAEVDPQGPTQGENRVLRGGSWADDPRRCRTSVRHCHAEWDLDQDFGFRVAADVPPKAP